METTKGVIELKLYDATPLHRDNFVKLVKEGAYELSRKDLKVVTPIVVGEGKKDCYLYLGEVKATKGRHMAAFGLDLFSGHPECTALLDGIVDVLRSW